MFLYENVSNVVVSNQRTNVDVCSLSAGFTFCKSEWDLHCRCHRDPPCRYQVVDVHELGLLVWTDVQMEPT